MGYILEYLKTGNSTTDMPYAKKKIRHPKLGLLSTFVAPLKEMKYARLMALEGFARKEMEEWERFKNQIRNEVIGRWDGRDDSTCPKCHKSMKAVDAWTVACAPCGTAVTRG